VAEGRGERGEAIGKDRGGGGFRLRDMGLFTVCAVFVIDTLPASAAIGPAVAGWWVLAALLFFLPYGLVSAELGSAYPERGGLYVWIRRAYGDRWGARATWLYWANVALGMPSIYVMAAAMAARMFRPDLSLRGQIGIALGMTWATVAAANRPLSRAKDIPNLGALVKTALVGALAAAALLHVARQGPANDLAWPNLLPSADAALSFLPILLFNLAGFELMSGASEEMEDPRRDVPRAIGAAGLLITGLYLSATLSLLAVLPLRELSLVNGILDALRAVFGATPAGRALVTLLGTGVLFTFFATLVTWTLGVSRAAARAAEEGELPRAFGIRDRRDGTPLGASLLAGLVSSAVLIGYGLRAGDSEELFWSLTALASAVFLLPYGALFPAFWTLRRRDPDRPRPYRIPGPDWVAAGIAGLAGYVVLQSLLLFVWVPGRPFDPGFALPLIAGVLATLAAGELLIRRPRAPGPRA